MIKDRGNKKWTSLMLVDHKRKLKKLKQNQNNKEKPELEEHKLQELNYRLKKAIKENLEVSIKYYHKKDFLYYQGKIQQIQEKIIILKNDENIYKLKADNILDIKFI